MYKKHGMKVIKKIIKFKSFGVCEINKLDIKFYKMSTGKLEKEDKSKREDMHAKFLVLLRERVDYKCISLFLQS